MLHENEENDRPSRLTVKEVDNGWIIEYRLEYEDHIVICKDQFDVLFFLQKLICPPTPTIIMNPDNHRGPYR